MKTLSRQIYSSTAIASCIQSHPSFRECQQIARLMFPTNPKSRISNHKVSHKCKSSHRVIIWHRVASIEDAVVRKATLQRCQSRTTYIRLLGRVLDVPRTPNCPYAGHSPQMVWYTHTRILDTDSKSYFGYSTRSQCDCSTRRRCPNRDGP